MKVLVFMLVAVFASTAVAIEATQESPLGPAEIEEILDFESIDRENEKEFRKRLHRRDPREDEAEGRVELALGPGEGAVDGRQV